MTYYGRATNKIVWAEGRDGCGNDGRLCVKGRYGWDYAHARAAADEAAHPPAGVLPEGAAVAARSQRRGGKNAASITPKSCRRSARRRGTRRST